MRHILALHMHLDQNIQLLKSSIIQTCINVLLNVSQALILSRPLFLCPISIFAMNSIKLNKHIDDISHKKRTFPVCVDVPKE